MNCDEVRLELALWVGNDLDDPARIEELRRHVATCPDCRLKAKSLRSSMVLLGASDPDSTFDTPESLWPELNARIEYLERMPKSPPPYGSWVLASVCGLAVCGGIWAWMNRTTPSSPPPTPHAAPLVPALSPGHSPGNETAPNP